MIVAAIIDHSEPMSPIEIAEATGKSRANVRQLLRKMAKSEELYKVGKKYWTEPVYPDHTDHIGHREEDE